MTHFGSRLSAAQPVPQAIHTAAGAVVEARGDAGDGNADTAAAASNLPSRKPCRRTSPKQTRKSAATKQTRKGRKPAIRRERIKAKKPRKIAALRMTDPDWPWPLPCSYLRLLIWKQQMFYRRNRLWNRREGITGPDEERRAQIMEWRELLASSD